MWFVEEGITNGLMGVRNQGKKRLTRNGGGRNLYMEEISRSTGGNHYLVVNGF